MDVNAYLPLVLWAVFGAFAAALVSGALGGKAPGFAVAILGAIVGGALGFYLETNGQLSALAESFGHGLPGLIGANGAAGAGGGAAVGLILALLVRRRG